MSFKIVCLLIAMINIYVINSYKLASSQESKEIQHICGSDQVYINRSSKEGCYPKAKLDQECLFDRQCSNVTSFSFCGLDQLSDNSICMCKDGFMRSHDLSACSPYTKCAFKGFNSAMESSNECGHLQFCRRGICLCLPNYEFNQSGKCAPIVYPDEETSNLDEGIIKIVSDTKSRIDALNAKAGATQTILIILLTGLVGAICGWVGYKVYTKKSNTFNRIETNDRVGPGQADQNDPLNRN